MKKIGLFKRFFHEENAQVTVEYVLTLAVMISGTVFILYQFQDVLKKFWQALINKVAQGCPSC